MTKRAARVLTWAIWAIGMVPAALIMVWLEMVAATWQGFLTAYGILAAIALSFEIFQGFVERLLRRRAEKRSVSSAPPR
jgi:hypothetical protein